MRLKILFTGLSIAALSLNASAWNLRTAPFTIFGAGTESSEAPFVNIETDYAVGDHLSLGPTLTLSANLRDWQVGVRANWYQVNTFEQGWLTSLEVNTLYYESDTETCLSTVTDEFGDWCDEYKTERLWSTRIRALQNYHFQWETFNLDLGIGSQVRLIQGGSIEMMPASEFSLGWLF